MNVTENLELIEKGELKRDYSGVGASDDDEDEDYSEPATPLTPAQVNTINVYWKQIPRKFKMSLKQLLNLSFDFVTGAGT